MRVWPTRCSPARSIIALATSRSSALAPASAKAIGSPCGSGDQVQPQPPEPAGVRRAPAVLGPAGEAGALLGFAAGAAFDGGGVDQPDVVVPRRALACQSAGDTGDRPRGAAQPLVVAVAVGHIGKPRPQMLLGESHELRLVVIAQQRRDHRQGDQLRIRQPRRDPHPGPLRRPIGIAGQQVVDAHIQCSCEGAPSPGPCPGPPRSRRAFTPRAWTPSPHPRRTPPLGTNHLERCMRWLSCGHVIWRAAGAV